jgi:hypothetical protein
VPRCNPLRPALFLTPTQRNLVDNGGWLDEVHWVQNTDKKEDLEYLEEILASSPRYRKIDLTGEGVGFIGYANAWGHLERGKLYFKIDDDIVSLSLEVSEMRFRSDRTIRSGLPMMLYLAL